MRLIYRIFARVSLALLPTMALWAALFYVMMVGAINDEADDALEDYSELIIKRMLAGKELPSVHSNSNNEYTITPIGEEVVADEKMIEYRSVRVYIEEKNETEPARLLITHFRDAEGGRYRLEVRMPTFERKDLFETILWSIVFLYLILLVTVVTVAVAVVQRSMRPLYSLLAWIDAYTLGHSTSCTVPNNSDTEEFRRLARATQDMVNRAEKVYERQKEFVGNASHELQTPLAILSTRLEYLMDNTSLDEEQIAEVVKMQRTIGHINRLNKTLLLLSRIDNGQFPEGSTFDLAALTLSQLESCCEVFSSRRITLTKEVASPCMVHMNESLASTLISNLLRNAFLHSDEGSQVRVSLSDKELIVENSGSEPLDSDHIFDRFYRGNNRREGSTGLGLALVSAICRNYSLPIEYRFVGGKHRFVLTFERIKG